MKPVIASIDGGRDSGGLASEETTFRDVVDERMDVSEIEGARSLGRAGKVLSRKDRLQVFGIDCAGPYGDGILFKGGEWIPGGHYVQRLRVKNVSTKLKKLKYCLPTTKYFSMAFPEVIVLSPGTVKEVDVVFCPKSCGVYDDVIMFKALEGPNAGGFNVPVRALLPTLQVAIPEGLDFGYCPVDDLSERELYIQNVGEVPAPYQWDAPPPFVMSPSEGVVAVGGSENIVCSVKPVDASVFVSQAVLRVGDGVNAIKPAPLLEIKVSAVGKYCHVVLSEEELDFGSQTIPIIGVGTEGDRGGYPRKDFTLRNQSVVPATFKIRRSESDRDAVFSLNPSEGVIPPEDDIVITATYSPISAGTFSRDHYEIVTVGGNKVTIGIQGRAVGSSVRLKKKEDPFAKGYGVPDSVSFRDVKVGETTTRVVFLFNESSTPCRFCFAIQGETSIFRFSSTRGIIPSCGNDHPGEAQVTLTFTPTRPTNYYRRIFCILENQQPLMLDAMGTGYVVAKGEVQEQRPAPLRHAHVQAFRNRDNVGLGRYSPEELDELLEYDGMSDLFAKVGHEGTLPLQRCSVARPLTRSGETSRGQAAVAAEFFVDPADTTLNVVYLDRSIVNLGFALSGLEETLFLTNNSNMEVHVVWNMRSTAEDTTCAGLQVTPQEADVPAGGSFPFRVYLVPTKRNCYFAEEAEAFVYPSNQITFRMVKDATQQPPWCLPLRVLGHSFVGEQFLANGSLSTQHTGHKLFFPACHVGDTVYQTIRLSNQGNIPACFTFQSDPFGVFDMKPVAGLVPAGDFQLCLVRFTPSGTGAHRHRLKCVLNNDPGSTHEAELIGQGAVPAIQMLCTDKEYRGGCLSTSEASSSSPADMERDVVYLRPTCVGIVYSGTLKVKNTSRIPVIYTTDPPKGSSGVLVVSPRAGLLLGNQTAALKLTFAPREAKAYQFILPLKVRSILGNAPQLTDCRQLGEASPAVMSPGAYVRIFGLGERGAVSFQPDSLEYSVRLANTSESKALVLENRSACDVTYKLFYVTNKEPPIHHSSRESTFSEDGAREKDRCLRPVPNENREAKDCGGGTTMEAFFIDQPLGILPARSRTRTIATFRPISAGEYDLSILCQVCAVSKTTDANTVSPLELEMAELGHKARVAAAQLGDMDKAEIMSGDLGGGQGWPQTHGRAVSRIMPLQCKVSGRASFPKMVFRDVRMTSAEGGDIPGASPRNLWSALSLAKINEMLSKPLSEEDMSFNQQSSPDTSQLPHFGIPFFPIVIGTGPVIITLQVCNPGFLKTSVTVNFPTAKTVEMETWATEGRPTAEVLRQKDIIDKLQVFAFSPDPGTVIEVLAGECQTLTISYSADSLSYGGVHDLPMLVRITKGRQFWLDLKGTTLPLEYPMLYVPTGLERQYVLEPVAVGTPLAEAPMQTTELVNVGDTSVSYRVDVQGIERANAVQGHGIPIFRLEVNNGTIPGGSSGFLVWRFLPLEAKEYVLKVVVRTEARIEQLEEKPSEQYLNITLRGLGYDPRIRDPHSVESLPGRTSSEKLPEVDLGRVHPPRQLEVPYGQYCVLGSERLRLGRIPQGTVFSRVVSIRNCLLTASVDFSWDPDDTGLEHSLISSGAVCIRPSKGRLEQGQSVLLQVNISASCGPRFLGQHPVTCILRLAPPTAASRSRKPKSRLQSRLELERQARARLLDPRVPVVSRPTTARTMYMGEIARNVSHRRNTGDSGRVLVPRYPTSTLNAPIARVLVEDLVNGETKDENREGCGTSSSRRSNHRAEGLLGVGSDQNDWNGGKNGGAGSSKGLTRSTSSTKGSTTRSNSGGQSERRSTEERRSAADSDIHLIHLTIEGEVICNETYHALFGGHRKIQRRTEVSEDFDNGDIGFCSDDHSIKAGTFFVPRPSEYVPDWPAFGPGGRREIEVNNRRSRLHGKASSTGLLTAKRGSSDLDAFIGDVTSRVLQRLMGEVVASDAVRKIFTALPTKARVPLFREIRCSSYLADRLAAALAPHLHGSRVQLYQSPPPTPAAAAAFASASLGVDQPRLDANTPLEKRRLLLAISAAGSGIAPTGTVAEINQIHGRCGKAARPSSCVTQPRRALARVAAAVENFPVRKVSLADLVLSLDITTACSLDNWLNHVDLDAQSGATAFKTVKWMPARNAALVTKGPTPDRECSTGLGKTSPGDFPASTAGFEGIESSHENKAAVTIQAQVRRLQAVKAADDAAEERRHRLVDEACFDPRVQRTVAAALEGTFFNMMQPVVELNAEQEAVNGQFKLSKQPTRFAIRNRGPQCGQGSTGITAVTGVEDAAVPGMKPSPIRSFSLSGEEGAP